MKKIIGMALCLSMTAMLFTGCSSSGSGGADKKDSSGNNKVGVALPTKELQRWNQDGANIKKELEAAKKLDEAVYLGGIDNETDISGQIDLMNQAMEQGADGILLAPADSNSLADSCQKVREKDIPVVLIDSSINSSEFDACYMTDNIDAGEMAAKEMLELQ